MFGKSPENVTFLLVMYNHTPKKEWGEWEGDRGVLLWYIKDKRIILTFQTGKGSIWHHSGRMFLSILPSNTSTVWWCYDFALNGRSQHLLHMHEMAGFVQKLISLHFVSYCWALFKGSINETLFCHFGMLTKIQADHQLWERSLALWLGK